MRCFCVLAYIFADVQIVQLSLEMFERKQKVIYSAAFGCRENVRTEQKRFKEQKRISVFQLWFLFVRGPCCYLAWFNLVWRGLKIVMQEMMILCLVTESANFFKDKC